LAAGCVALAMLAAAAGEARASACDRASDEPTQANRRATTLATVCLMNAERRRRDLRPLHLSRPLSSAAQRHSRDMVRRRYFSHAAPRGAGPVTRIRRSGYLRSADRWFVGENIAWGSRGASSAGATVRAWMRSPAHRREILHPAYRDVGIGVAPGVPDRGRPGGATYTADFGVRR